MTRNIAVILGVILMVTCREAVADEIIVSPDEVRNLGVELAVPRKADEIHDH